MTPAPRTLRALATAHGIRWRAALGVTLAALAGACTGQIADADCTGSATGCLEAGPGKPGSGAAPAGSPAQGSPAQGLPGQGSPAGATPPGGVEPGGRVGLGATPVAAATCTPRPGPAPLRRLNRSAYDNAIRDLLGDTTRSAQAGLPTEPWAGGFSNQAVSASTSPLLVQGYLEVAEGIAARAMKGPFVMQIPCSVKAGDEICARKFAETFGKRAWRHPLSPTDLDELMALYRVVAADGGGFSAGMQAMVEGILQSPDFLYFPEVGTPASNGTRRLTSFEVAARLAFTLWGSTPDSALLVAAEANQLTDKDQIIAQARRLLADARAKTVVQRFSEEWLGITGMGTLTKDAKPVPLWKESYPSLFRDETRRFFEDLVFSETRPSALSLFSGRSGMMNATLAGLYGASGPAGAAFERVTLPDRRAGVLTQMSLLATYARSNQTDPIQRGKFVRLKLLCGDLPPPPNDVDVKVPDISPNLTTRERFDRHEADPACGGCHKLIDPIGLTFENYDAMGMWRDQENGKPVDGSGRLLATDVDGPVANALELGARLGRSDQARACIVKQWFRYTFGRREDDVDECTIAKLTAGFEKDNFDLAGLIVNTLQTETFVARQIGGAL